MIKIRSYNEMHEVNLDLLSDKRLNDLEKIEFSNEIMKYFIQEKVKNFDDRVSIYYADFNDSSILIKSYIKNVFNYSSGQFLNDLNEKPIKVVLYYNNDNNSFYLIFNLSGPNSELYTEILNRENNKEDNNEENNDGGEEN